MPTVATLARWVHVASSVLLLLPLGAHFAIVLGHHFILRDGLIARMLKARTSGGR
jgi:cytochrome b561